MKKSFLTVSKKPQRGISLIIVLIMTVVIGLTAAAAMRGATSSQRVTNNVRMENMAQQYAEAALRYCEEQVQLSDTDPTKQNFLKGPQLPVRNMTVTGTIGNWQNTSTWLGTAGVGTATTRTPLPQARYDTSGLSSTRPAKAPECVAEIQTLGSPSFTLTVVTSRGFSSDYKADSTTGQTTNGSVVWLQSVLNLCAGVTPTCP